MATKEHSTSVTAAVEDYAKAIYALETHTGDAVTNNALAERLGVTAASASNMVKKLDQLGLVEHVPYKGVRLTGSGTKVALEVLRHHRLLELYLAETLDVPWDRVHDEAEVLEHVLSEELEELIARKLGNPTHDPHGRPHLRLRSRDAPLPRRSGHRARRRVRGGGEATVRRSGIGALPRPGAGARRRACAGHARGGA